MVKKKKLKVKTKKIIFLLAVVFLIPFFLLVFFNFSQPAVSQTNKQQFLSPLAQSATTENQQLEKIYPLEYYLNLSDSFLTKATRLANDNQQQRETDRLKIISTLNRALKATNQAVKYYPRHPQGYLQRAQIWQKTSHLWPESKKNADQDLKTAKALMTDQQLPSPPPGQQPLNFIPTQKANLAKKITIAEPNQPQATSGQAEVENNSLSGKEILPAGEKEIKIAAPGLKKDSLIYLTPLENNNNRILYLKARKDKQWFIAAADQAVEKDLAFKWWIIED